MITRVFNILINFTGNLNNVIIKATKFKKFKLKFI